MRQINTTVYLIFYIHLKKEQVLSKLASSQKYINQRVLHLNGVTIQ